MIKEVIIQKVNEEEVVLKERGNIKFVWCENLTIRIHKGVNIWSIIDSDVTYFTNEKIKIKPLDFKKEQVYYCGIIFKYCKNVKIIKEEDSSETNFNYGYKLIEPRLIKEDIIYNHTETNFF